MRHFVECHYCGNKIYFQSDAETRQDLPWTFDLQCYNHGCSQHRQPQRFGPHDVSAEKGLLGRVGAAIVLGLLGGAAGGPAGAALGGLLGFGAGSEIDESDEERVRRFNRS